MSKLYATNGLNASIRNGRLKSGIKDIQVIEKCKGLDSQDRIHLLSKISLKQPIDFHSEKLDEEVIS